MTKMKHVSIKAVQQTAAWRPAGYVEEVLSSGKQIDEDTIVMPEETFIKLVDKYRHPVPHPPKLSELLGNFRQSISKWKKSGYQVVSKKTFKERLETCRGCNLWDENVRFGLGKCKECGCTSLKLWLASETCPLKKW